MPNLIDRLIDKVDTLRQTAATKFGLPPFDMYRVIRTYTSGIIGDGAYTETETLLSPPPMVKFDGGDKLERGGRHDQRTMKATEVSLSYEENWLQGADIVAGQVCFYRLDERNSTTAADSTTWTLSAVPEADRENLGWILKFRRLDMC